MTSTMAPIRLPLLSPLRMNRLVLRTSLTVKMHHRLHQMNLRANIISLRHQHRLTAAQQQAPNNRRPPLHRQILPTPNPLRRLPLVEIARQNRLYHHNSQGEIIPSRPQLKRPQAAKRVPAPALRRRLRKTTTARPLLAKRLKAPRHAQARPLHRQHPFRPQQDNLHKPLFPIGQTRLIASTLSDRERHSVHMRLRSAQQRPQHIAGQSRFRKNVSSAGFSRL